MAFDDALADINAALAAPQKSVPQSAIPATGIDAVLQDLTSALHPVAPPVYAGPGNAERVVEVPRAAAEPRKQPVKDEDLSFLANLGTGIARMPAAVASLPHTAADIYMGATGDRSGIASAVSKYSPTEPEATNLVFKDINALTGGNAKPYQPQTLPGQILQDTIATSPLALVGPAGAANVASREMANLGGIAGSHTAAAAFPDSPGIQTLAALGGAGMGAASVPLAIGAAGQVGNAGGRFFNTEAAQNRYAARNLLNSAGVPKDDIVDSIDRNAPAWGFPGQPLQPAPDLGTVTQNPGIQGMVYRDRAAAERAGNPVYRENFLQTNQAQRDAISGITPNIDPNITQARGDLARTIAGLPNGVTAQDAGATFRQGLQTVYDQRIGARQQVGQGAFSPLETSSAKIDLRPVMDYATEQAAKNAGEVGKAYKAALGQFQSGTGITLDTAPFANSSLKGLGDLAGSYPPGSASQRAVLDIKSRAEDAIMNQEPAVGQARSAYAQASRPLDVFDPTHSPGPIPNAIAQTRFGGYVSPNEAVVSSFLRSQAGPDAIDALHSVFPDVKAATQPLQDYIASQVQRGAMNPDGSVNLAKLQSITNQFPALNKAPFADLRQQFSNVEGAQGAVDALAARKNLYDTFQNGLNSSMQVDQAGNRIYTPKLFDRFVNDNQGELVAAYGQDGADRIHQINKQLSDMAQGQYVRAAGQSGTPQAMGGSGNVLNRLFAYESGGEALGDLSGFMLGKVESILGSGAIGRIAGLGVANQLRKFDNLVEGVTRNALTDPAFARSLLTNYNPASPTAAGARAMNYVRNSITGGLAGELAAPQQQILPPPAKSLAEVLAPRQ